MASRLKPEEKSCLQCNKTFYAKRKDAKYCGNVCRSVAHVVAKEKPAFIEQAIQEATPAIKEQAVQEAAPAIRNEAIREMFDLIGHGGIQHTSNGWKIRLNTGNWVTARTAEKAMDLYNEHHTEYLEKYNSGLVRKHPHHR